ncbi:MAG: hypothetical protein LM600_04560 [Thaumarchaeota archaeon]|jgi:hypothetical protein|nr:hypothetical protein [Nitrososphaerota archaeon]
MLVALIEHNSVYYTNLLQKLDNVKKRIPIHVDVFARKGAIYVIGLDDGFSATFIYMAYLKAKEKGLNAKLLYAMHIDGSWLPEEVRKLGEKWLYQRLGISEIEALKKISITEHVFDRWCRW